MGGTNPDATSDLQPAPAEKQSRSSAVWHVAVSARDPGLREITDDQDRSLMLRSTRLYVFQGRLSRADVQDACTRLLCDPVSETFEIRAADAPWHFADPTIDILPRPGVMDPAAASARDALCELGHDVDQVRTGRRHAVVSRAAKEPVWTVDGLQALARQLANPLIERVSCHAAGDTACAVDPFSRPAAAPAEVREVALREAGADQLTELSRAGHLFLSPDEMQAIQSYYRELGREPTDIELETLAQTWSEHCVHKTLKSAVRYRGAGFPEVIDISGRTPPPPQIERRYGNLLVDTIAAATRQLDRPWCWSVFVDNAGVIELNAEVGVAFKVETHNHPSALEPYGGAATGIGGCIRDIMGCGLGARPIANTDVFCFASPDLPRERVPTGLFHPARSMREVVRGVRDYGNRMGIPTVNGALAFDDRYLGNPLVFCGCVGVLPRHFVDKETRDGDRIVVVGGRTGRDGIHGATFSSGAMSDTHVDEFAHAVQVGNAITEKKVLDVLMQARDHVGGPLYRCVTDCGAGGLSSAVGEMGEQLGAEVELQRVPLKYDGLRYDEIWISEAQERMVLAVQPDQVERLIALCAAEDVEATDIGVFGGSGRMLRLHYHGNTVGELDMAFLHDGVPKREREATWSAPQTPAGTGSSTGFGSDGDLQNALLSALQHPDIASKEWIIRQYDHEVQAGSVIKPLMGPGAGPSDGAVVRPLLDAPHGIVLSCGLCPGLSDIDPYIMAVAALDEAVRNNLCVGGNLERMAVLDNFCWGGVATADAMGGLVRAAQACHDAALAYGVPFISGKDSLNNVFEMQPQDAERMGWPQRLQVPDTLLISAISVTPDIMRSRSSDLKSPGNTLLWLRPNGHTLSELAAAARAVDRIFKTVDGIRAVHDISDGGLLVAAAEMVIGSRHGLRLDAAAPAEGWCGAMLGAYLVEVQVDSAPAVADPAIQTAPIGAVTDAPRLDLTAGTSQAAWPADNLRAAWRSTFNWD